MRNSSFLLFKSAEIFNSTGSVTFTISAIVQASCLLGKKNYKLTRFLAVKNNKMHWQVLFALFLTFLLIHATHASNTSTTGLDCDYVSSTTCKQQVQYSVLQPCLGAYCGRLVNDIGQGAACMVNFTCSNYNKLVLPTWFQIRWLCLPTLYRFTPYLFHLVYCFFICLGFCVAQFCCANIGAYIGAKV